MEEARRFLRYVIPGLVFMMEVSLYLALSSYDQFIELIKVLGKGIGLPISMFLASGGIGFLLGVIYYPLSRYKWLGLARVNYLPLIDGAVKKGWLKLLRHVDRKEADISKLTESDAWCR